MALNSQVFSSTLLKEKNNNNNNNNKKNNNYSNNNTYNHFSSRTEIKNPCATYRKNSFEEDKEDAEASIGTVLS